MLKPAQILKDCPDFYSQGADVDQLHLHVSEVGPSQRAHPPHQHDGQEIFYVLEGNGEVLHGDQTFAVSSGEAMHVECSILHGIQNIGDGPLRYAVIIAKCGQLT